MKKCMNFKFVVLFALTLLAGSTVYGQDNVIDEVVWVVGDEAILKSEVEEARMSALYEGRKFDRDPYCVIPEEIAVQKLFLHQAALDSIEVSEAEVIQRVDYMTNMYITNIGSREKMEEYFNKTSSQIRETLRDNAREGLKVQKMQQKLVGEIKITPAEVRRYFKDLPQDSRGTDNHSAAESSFGRNRERKETFARLYRSYYEGRNQLFHVGAYVFGRPRNGYQRRRNAVYGTRISGPCFRKRGVQSARPQ